MSEIDPDSDVPVYRQVAADLRSRIEAGTLRPRRPLPSEARLQQEFGVARDTVRRAVAYLAELGLVHTVSGRGTYVRAGAVELAEAGPGSRVFARRATDTERATFELAEDVWVLVIERPGVDAEVLPADAAEVRVPD
ncbi:GntR family transcriptional regulator [Streptosporangium sp. KLBMP 9127]|nr:GntR family transcriptional regulator [Streptosporangium sp. KLBMP 9127]